MGLDLPPDASRRGRSRAGLRGPNWGFSLRRVSSGRRTGETDGPVSGSRPSYFSTVVGWWNDDEVGVCRHPSTSTLHFDCCRRPPPPPWVDSGKVSKGQRPTPPPAPTDRLPLSRPGVPTENSRWVTFRHWGKYHATRPVPTLRVDLHTSGSDSVRTTRGVTRVGGAR